MSKGYVVLEDGRAFDGEIVTGDLAVGEAVFNTSLTGYQEILTDPSYAGQIITMTYPHIGNYGIVSEDDESRKIFASGLVVKEFSKMFSNWRAENSLGAFLDKRNVTAIEGIDTRALTKHIRDQGAMRAAIGTAAKHSKKSLHEIALQAEKMEGLDLASKVTIPEPYAEGAENSKFYVVALDFGIKQNILRKLVGNGCKVEVLPARTPASKILDKKPDGIFLSNGPGDPAPLDYAIENIKQLLGKAPIFGICLGHQLLSLALGLSTFKLKFGHRGANHPVKNLMTGKVEITSQNHGFGVSLEGLDEIPPNPPLSKGEKGGFLLKIIDNEIEVEGFKGNKDSDKTIKEGVVSVEFYPQGNSSGGIIFVKAKDKTLSIDTDIFTGRVRILTNEN